MTLPVERTQAILQTREFLVSLLQPGRLSKKSVSARAYALLRHYPTALAFDHPGAAFARSRPNVPGLAKWPIQLHKV